MKTVIMLLTGTPAKGDFPVLHYTVARGGHSLAGYRVQAGDTMKQVTFGLAQMCMHLMTSSVAMKGALEIVGKGNKVLIRCNNELNDATWWFTLDEVGDGEKPEGDLAATFEEI